MDEANTQTHAAEHPHPNYYKVFLALVVLTGASFVVSIVAHAPVLLWLFVLAVAVAKAALVALNFMHLKYEAAWKYVLLIPPCILGLVLVLALVPDMVLAR